ncbi:phage tail protein [Empedobacter sp.]|uniref:phage tail protein n=1 Tax=Empedobacter sp. TaxID=1927715 RepID=UPI0028A7FE73|nr:phage tail protein [Empedobacter sp.]
MEQILVKRSDNVDYLLEDRNKGVFVSSIIQSTELRSNDVINVELSSREFINFTIGDSFHYLGQKYTLNQIPRYFKNSSNDFQFSITFEGVMFDLRRASYDVNIDTTGSAIYGETLTADLELFATILIENINRVFPGKWVLGEIPAETETKTITFSEEENCLAALQMLCDEYDTDFIIKTDNNGVNILNFKQIGEEISLEFKVGFQKGLYTLTREKVDASDIVTRLKVYGSDKNLGTDYRANRLVLKDKNKPNSYIENTQAVAKYGIYESTKIFDDIYPRRKGKVTSINSDSVYKFSDSSMDFDLKEKDENGTKYLLNGVNAKIHFNTGDLAGYELEIHDYNHETKEFHIVKFADENGYEFPSKDSDAFRIGIGDEYVILDIQMPQTYIDNAEAELFDKADEYLSDKLEPNIQYLLDVDTLHLQRILNDTVTQFFLIGDFIKVIDEDFDINRYIRIKSIERDLKNPFDYKLTLSDSKVTNFLSGTIPGEINTIKNIIKLNNLNDPAKARRNWKDAQEVLNMVFDVEGDYYTDKIKPNSIETTHLQVGAKSMQFNLIDSFFEPNFEGNPNKIRWSTCKLVHFAISDKIVDWQIQGGLKDLEANKPYYLYAKCNKSNNIGVIEITETQYVVDQGNFYYFLIGIINSYSEDVKAREISLMYGFTTVSGRFIKTGRIESSGGGTYFDLDTGEISGKITFTSDSPAFNQVKDSIQIGGRNLILNSKDQRNVFRAEMYPESYIYYDISNGKLEPNTEYILTWEYLTSGNFKPSMAYFVSDVGEHRSISGIEATYNTWVKKEWKFTTLSNPDQQGAIRFDHKGTIDGQNCLLAVRMVKLEKGNKATDWTPAPEDIEASILQSKTDSINSSKAYSDAQDELKRIQTQAYADSKITDAEQRAIQDATNKAEAAKLYADAQDALLKAQLEAYADGQITAEEQARIQQMQDNLAAAKAYADAQANLAKIAAAAYADGIVDEEEARAIADATAKMEAAKQHAQSLVNSIQIGGRNLILNSKDQRNVYRAETYPESYIYYDISNGKLEPNTEYILTWEYLTSGNFKPSMAYFVSDVGEHRSISGIEATYNTWVKKEWKFTTLSNPDQQGAIRFDHKGTIDGQNCLLAVRMVKLEKGNKATDWTPAPEDVDSAINDVKVKAEQALTQLTSIANDNILSPSEKQQVSNEWNRIKSEYTSNYALAINNGISTTDYMNSYNDLYNYITPLLVSLSIDSPIVGDVFRTKFKAYYDQNITLVVAVNDKLRLGVTANTSAISQVNATIERINKITSFLGTTVDNNVVATGVALVGQGTTGTGGLSGIRDNGDDSIFLFAGADFNNRYRARWIMSHGGFERGYHSNGILGFERGYDGSKWIFNMYNESGAPLFQLDSVRGLVPVNYTSESWSRVTLLKTNIVTRDYNTVQSSLRSFIESNVSVSSVRHNPDEYFNYMYWVYSYSYNNIYVCWDYYNGTHPNNAQYANYVGYKVTSDSRTNNITDGWYFRAMDGVFSIRDSPNGSQTFELYATVYYIQNGKIVETQNLNYIK